MIQFSNFEVSTKIGNTPYFLIPKIGNLCSKLSNFANVFTDKRELRAPKHRPLRLGKRDKRDLRAPKHRPLRLGKRNYGIDSFET